MKLVLSAIVMVAATPGLAQDAPQDAAARLEAMTCRDFLALGARDRETVKAALLAHASGDPLPDPALPGSPAADATAPAAEGTGGEDRGLVAMRTSCDGAPDVRALDALRAAFGNNL